MCHCKDGGKRLGSGGQRRLQGCETSLQEWPEVMSRAAPLVPPVPRVFVAYLMRPLYQLWSARHLLRGCAVPLVDARGAISLVCFVLVAQAP